VRERAYQENGIGGPPRWATPALRALNEAVLAALEAGDIDAARAAARALARLLEGT
jgi:hypothetical protein